MSIKELFQGNWFGHPLHPALVHVPTGLWPAALIFDLVSLAGEGSDAAVRIAFWALATGLVVALAAVPTGLADWWGIKKENPPYKLGLWHMILNLAVAALVAASLWVRWRQGLDVRTVAPAAIALNAAANMLLLVSGYIGGRMVFNHGTSVARQSKDKWRAIAQAGKARLPAE